MTWVLLITLVVGFLAAASSAAAASLGCCSLSCPEDTGPCQRMTPAGCCESAPLASGPNGTQMPAIAVVLRSTLRASVTARSTPGHVLATLQGVCSTSLVLRL